MFCYRLFSLLCFRFRNVERRFVPDTVCLHGVSHRNLSGWGRYDIQATCAWIMRENVWTNIFVRLPMMDANLHR